MNLVIVESPAKAKTINKYLGKNYKVLASYGHVRDLPSKNGSVDPDNNFKMLWEIDSFSKKYLKEITDTAADSEKITFAINPNTYEKGDLKLLLFIILILIIFTHRKNISNLKNRTEQKIKL